MSDRHVIEFIKLDPSATVPAAATAGDAGLDLTSVERAGLKPHGHQVVRTGIGVALPPGLCGLILPRSGLAARHGVTVLNAPGLIDSGYRGELGVILHNTTARFYWVEAGDRIAQFLVQPHLSVELVPSEAETLEQFATTERGTGGFGSTGYGAADLRPAG